MAQHANWIHVQIKQFQVSLLFKWKLNDRNNFPTSGGTWDKQNWNNQTN